MYCVLYICFAFLVSTVRSLHKPRWKLGPELASSAELADLASKHKTLRANHMDNIDMDYIGGSSERARSQKTSDERSDMELPQLSVDRSHPIIVYVSDPRVLQEQLKKLKKVRVTRDSSSESDGVTYEDLMKFLMQVGAILKDQKGVVDPFAHHFNPVDLIRNTRKRTDDEMYESDKLDEPELQPSKYIEDSIEENKYSPKKKIVKSMDAIYKSPRNKRVSIEELPRGNRKRKISDEVSPRKKRFEPRFRNVLQRSKNERTSPKISNFYRTPKPFIGKAGIYEDK